MRRALLLTILLVAAPTWANSTFTDDAEPAPKATPPAAKAPATPSLPKNPPRQPAPVAPAPAPIAVQPAPRPRQDFPSCDRPTANVARATAMFQQLLGISNALEKRLSNAEHRASFQLFAAGQRGDVLMARISSASLGNHDLPASVCQQGENVVAFIDAGWGGRKRIEVQKIDETTVELIGNELRGEFKAASARRITNPQSFENPFANR